MLQIDKPLRPLCIMLFALATLLPMTVRRAEAALPEETKEQMDKRMGWWREGKFGMFIHWGLYAIPAGEWKGQKVGGVGEWIMNTARIPKEEYAPLQKQFNPVKFDARAWVDLAKRAGMKYIVITSKHHDGFCLFDSKLTDYDIMGTPYRKDLLRALADECHRQGIEICWYHSIMDWHHPNAHGANFPKYQRHMRGQLEELLTNYGRIGVLWFDGEWIGEWNEKQGHSLEQYIRGLQPELIVNNRVGKRKRSPGDFGTPEQEIPATGMPGWDWETCMTMNDTWGFKTHDHNWKSVPDILHKLVDIASKGGNFLLNVGPTAEGLIPKPSIERLTAVGKWLDTNGESVYGTTASPFKQLPWGRCTKKSGTLYLHVFDWPTDGQLVVPGLQSKVEKAYLLADSNKNALTVTRSGDNVAITLPTEALDPIDTVVVLKIDGEPVVVEPAVAQADDGTATLHARDALAHGHAIRYETGGGKDNIGFWINPADWVSWNLKVTQPGTFDIEITSACPDASAGSKYTVEVDNQKLSGEVPGTGDWTAFKQYTLGKVKLDEGRHTLTVKAENLVREGVMNLQSIVLKPR